MAGLISTCIKPGGLDDYCVDLRASSSAIVACFNSSNTIHVYSVPSLQLSGVYDPGCRGTISEVSVCDENVVAWSDRQGSIGMIDIRSNVPIHIVNTSEEIFTIDSDNINLVSGSNKQITIWDIRNFKPKRVYQDLFPDDCDVTSVRLSKTDPSILVSCCEDSMMGICDINSMEEDDYTLINVEEPALKVGFCDRKVFCVTINKLVSYDPHLENPETPLELIGRHKLFDYQAANPNLGYFIGAHMGDTMVLLGGSHE